MSIALAKAALPRLKKYKADIEFHALAYRWDPSLIAAIIARETSALPTYMLPPPAGRLGDGGHGAGPMQIDDRSYPEWHKRWKAGELTVGDAIEMGCKVLLEKYSDVIRLMPEVTDDSDRLRYAVAAYNTGVGNVRKSVRKGLDPDHTTTGKDYSKDVLLMADWFDDNGF